MGLQRGGNEFPCTAKETKIKVSKSVLNEGRRLNNDQQDMLIQPFCIDDVKQAIFDIDDIKAPG